MYALYVFGPRVEHAWGYKQFTLVLSALRAGRRRVRDVVHSQRRTCRRIGAGVFGVMTAYAMQWPDDEVYLMFVVPMRVRTLVVGLFVFNLVLGHSTGDEATVSNVAYFAHIGGAIVAYIYIRMATSTSMDQVRQRVANLPDADEPPRAIPRNLPRRERGDEVDDIVAKSKAIAAKRVAALDADVAPARSEGRRAQPCARQDLRAGDRQSDERRAKGARGHVAAAQGSLIGYLGFRCRNATHGIAILTASPSSELVSR